MSTQKPSLLARTLLGLIAIYRYAISPLIGQHCRFSPSCSSFAQEAVAQYGALKGSWLSIKRISRCHPYHQGGYDPVPQLPDLNNQK